MCGRFAVTTDPALLAARLDAIDETVPAAEDAWEPNYNVAPTSPISTLVSRHPREETDAPATRRLRTMRWGLLTPATAAAPDGSPATGGPLLINARAETVTTSPAFRGAARRKRCLVPMDGWYEWRGPKGDKTPFYLYAADGQPLLMAGLWSVWHPPGSVAGEKTPPILSATIITTDAVGPLAEIHDRMPLSIGAADVDRWLDPDAPADIGLLRGHGDLDRIAIREVSTLVNNARNNGPELIAPVEPKPEQVELF